MPEHDHSTHHTRVKQGPCPLAQSTASPQAAFAYVVSCDPAQASSHFQVRLDNGRNFTLTQVYGVSCADHGSASGAGFDTQRGDGKGLLNGKPAYVEWEFVDNGDGGANDSLDLRIRLPLCEPNPDDQPGFAAEDPALSPAGRCPTGPPRYFELDRTVFSGSGAPGQFPGSNQPTGRNTRGTALDSGFRDSGPPLVPVDSFGPPRRPQSRIGSPDRAELDVDSSRRKRKSALELAACGPSCS